MAVMTIFPEQSEIKEVARLLLRLADTPRDVTTTLDPTVGFTVPMWLYELFVEIWDRRLASNVGQEGPVVLAEEGTEEVEPAKRKPGRPRKEDK